MSAITLDNILARLFGAGGTVQSFDLFFRTLKKSLLALIFPLALLAAVAVLLPYAGKLPAPVFDIYVYIPYVLLVTALVLSWRFNRSRAFFPLVVLTIAYWSILNHVQGSDSMQADVIYALLCLTVPLNFAVFALVTERGIFSRRGFTRFLFIGTQVLLCFIAVRYALKPASQVLYVVIDTRSWLPSSHLPQITQPLLAVSFLLVASRVFQKRNAVEGGLAISLLAIGMAFISIDNSFLVVSYVALAALIMVITVIQDSWQMAYVDELTGLPGRRALNEQLLKLGQFYTIAMVDVDHFKQFNDSYGHDVGDQALRFVATKLEGVGSGGKAYRYGGEEFTLLFPNRSKTECKTALEAVHKSIAEAKFRIRAKDRPKEKPKSVTAAKKLAKGIKITVSMGVGECENGKVTPREVIKKADSMLYKAKDAGRNCIRPLLRS